MTICVQRVSLVLVVWLTAGLAFPFWARAVTVFSADGAELTESELTPPRHRLAVLFVHGHDPNPDPQHPNYRKNFHDSIDGLTSFKHTLDLPDNLCLGIEPYYLHFGDAEADHERSIDEDAAQIQEAVDLILARQRLKDPDNPDLKLAIIAYSKGSISTRLYMKQLHDAGEPIPVSEFVAIAPPNHGLNWPGLSGSSGYPSARQLNNGYSSLCTSFGDATVNYIANLNGHPIGDSASLPGFYPSEAPGSRPNGTAADQGVLYAAIYAANNGDFVGGSDPSGDCQGRVLAKNLAPDAVNLDDIVIPTQPAALSIPDWLEPLISPETRDKFARHQNTVHHPEVIFRALYTVTHRQAPAPGTGYGLVGGVPVIPPPAAQPPDAAVVLLFDTSGSMTWSHEGVPGVDAAHQRLTLAQQAAVPFLDMLQFFNPCRAAFGLARFPHQPYQGCVGEVVTPMAPVRADTVAAAIETTIPGLTAAGNTPLLAALGTAAGMFGAENRKALVLLSDGFHNCPMNSSLDDIGHAIDTLAANAVRTYAIGFGQAGEVPNDTLGQLAEQTQGGYYDVTSAAGFDPLAWNPATALQAAYKSILVDALQLEAAADPAGLILPGERKNHEFHVSDPDRKVAVFVSWAGPLKQRPDLVIRSSDGRNVPFRQTLPGIGFRDGPTFTLVKIDSAFLNQPGRVSDRPWSMELALQPEESAKQAVPYQWSVLTDSALALKGEVAMPAPRTGATLTLTARLTQNGRPPALPATVWARVARPQQALGNWLAASRVGMEELGQVPETRDGEALSPLLRKILYLTEFRKQPFAGGTVLDTVRLYDDGTHGDSAAGDGTYTGRYEGATVAGTYAFEFNASGRTARGLPFNRNQRFERHIPMKADAVHAEVIRLPGGKKGFDTFEIALRPADDYGNLLGPGRQHLILWEATAGEFPQPAVDHLDGTYSRQLKLPSTIEAGAVDMTFLVGDSPFRLNLAKALRPHAAVPVGWLIVWLVLLALILYRMLAAKNR
jgi:hypothetical protein